MNSTTIIENAIAQSFTYDAYKELIISLFQQGKTTGNTQNEAFVEYTKLSLSRMKRWEKTARINVEAIEKTKQIIEPQFWLVITEAWCGDAAHALPIIEKIAKQNSNIALRIVLRDENEALMNQFLTNQKKSIPKLIAVHKQNKEVLFTWGPRPKEAQHIVDNASASPEGITTETKETLQMWFNKDKGQQIVEEILRQATS